MANLIDQWTNLDVDAIARKFSRQRNFIRSLKFFFPVAAIILVLALIIYPNLYPEDKKILIEAVSMNEADVNPAMVNPRFEGFDKDNQPYAISAMLAYRQDDKKILLEQLTADMTLKNGTWASIVTPNGLYDMDKKYLQMDDIFEIFITESGARSYHITGSNMDVDLNTQVASSDKDVEAEGPMGTLEAGGFILFHKQGKISFKGPVKLVIQK